MNKFFFYFNEKIIFIKIPSILTSFIPFFLITGPFFPDLIVSLCALIFLINSIKNSLFSYYKSNFFILFILFYSILIISSLNSDLVIQSLKSSVPYIRFGIFTLSTWYLLNYDKKLINKIFNVTLFCFCLLIVDGFYQYFFGINLLGWKMVDTPRISSFFGKEWVLGSYLARLIPFFFGCFFFLYKDLNKKKIYLVYLIFILTETLIFLAGERTAFFLLNLSVIFILILVKKFRKVRLYCWLASAILILSINFINPISSKRIINTTAEQIGYGNERIYFFSKQHEDHIISAYKMFLSNKIFGIGPRLFRENCNKEQFVVSTSSCSTHPHNIYFEILAETGLLGFILICSIFFYLVFLFFRHLFYKLFLKKILFTDFSISLLACLFVSLWPIIPTGSFFNNWINVIYYLPIGFLIWDIRRNKI